MLTGPRLRDGGSTSAGPELYSSRLRMDNQWDPAVDWSSRTLSKRRVRRDRCIQNDYFFQRVRGKSSHSGCTYPVALFSYSRFLRTNPPQDPIGYPFLTGKNI